eukprot:TRINITY_DN1122_c0_g1_i4.p1 TRINITY_DN1122_c0_g1~~TRINITY_DN1122_c0_g1_i4.p1  ORF type:complete len:219 (+),score=44.51 TRINITY_DN1122_c0_g1_i4:52-657(+)
MSFVLRKWSDSPSSEEGGSPLRCRDAVVKQREMLTVEMISKSVMGMASRNIDVVYKQGEVGAEFSSLVLPEEGLFDYMSRPLFKKLRDSPAIWKAAFILIKRLFAAAPTILTPMTAHRIVLCAYLIAMKATTDRVLSNKLVSRYGGVALTNLNTMERHFLAIINWEVCISAEEYSALDSVYSLPLASSASKRLATAILFAR